MLGPPGLFPYHAQAPVLVNYFSTRPRRPEQRRREIIFQTTPLTLTELHRCQHIFPLHGIEVLRQRNIRVQKVVVTRSFHHSHPSASINRISHSPVLPCCRTLFWVFVSVSCLHNVFTVYRKTEREKRGGNFDCRP
jgi:hypothetical protein